MEKVIKGLECHQIDNDHRINCAGCPYYVDDDNHIRCVNDLHDDALALLKEQEAVEQKTGYWIDSAGNDKCSICGTEYSDLYPDYGNTHFCPNCGAKMEGR